MVFSQGCLVGEWYCLVHVKGEGMKKTSLWRAEQYKTRHWQKAPWSNPCDQSLALYLRPQNEDEHVRLWFAAEATRSQVQSQALIIRIYRHPTNTYEIYSLTSVRCSDTRTMQDLISAWLINEGYKQEACRLFCLRAANTEYKSFCRKDMEGSDTPDYSCSDKSIFNMAPPGLVSNFYNDSFLKIHPANGWFWIQPTISGYWE